MLNNADWKKLWSNHYKSYINTLPRTGIFIRHFIDKKDCGEILELGAGSCRDSFYLAKNNCVTATDFEGSILKIAEKHYTNDCLKFMQENALELSFKNNVFKHSFHNGLIVYFSDNKDIRKIISEQSRVTYGKSFIMAHNGENRKLRKTFEEQSKSSSLYDIRFYSKKELTSLVSEAHAEGKKIKFYKFGGPADYIYSILKKLRLSRSFVINSRFFCHIVFFLYQLTPLSRAERICVCVNPSW